MRFPTMWYVSRLTRFYYKVIIISELTSMVYCMLYLFFFPCISMSLKVPGFRRQKMWRNIHIQHGKVYHFNNKSLSNLLY